MTRIQAERFADKDEYERLKDCYELTASMLVGAKESLCILHPLPRVTEIAVDVDDDPRAAYFEQAEGGRYIRMALILMLLGTKGVNDRRGGDATTDESLVCNNPHCISRSERGIKRLFKDGNCIYCDQKAAKA
jgi:aspartate carbamoyltransferase catalytic subunit